MNTARMKQLVAEMYKPRYQAFSGFLQVQSACAKIVEEEFAKLRPSHDQIQVVRAIRTRTHEFLQTLTIIPDPELQSTSNAAEMRAQLAEHHEHQTAHFEALWEITEVIVDEAMKNKKVAS